MPTKNPFDEHYIRYENWFEKNEYVYKSELKAVKHFIPEHESSLEIGVGTGRFARPLGITTGIDPSQKMLDIAAEKGIDVYQGQGENLPFPADSFDVVLMVTTICFLDDIIKSFNEIKRVLKNGGVFVNGFVDEDSPLGEKYQKFKHKNVFYKHAEFHSAEEILAEMDNCDFKNPEIVQTIFGDLEDVNEVQDFKVGYGEGGFVVIKGEYYE